MADETEQVLRFGLLSTDEPCAHLVLGGADFNVEELRAAWAKFYKRLVRLPGGPLSGPYATILGFNPQTWRLHVHVYILESSYVPFSVLVKHARAVGFGRPWIKRVTEESYRLALATYARDNLLALRAAPEARDNRLRPFNTSTSWPRAQPA